METRLAVTLYTQLYFNLLPEPLYHGSTLLLPAIDDFHGAWLYLILEGKSRSLCLAQLAV